MTDTCSCPPGACHGGHTIDVGPARFREIPQTVSAIRWNGDNADAIKSWVGHNDADEPRFLLPDEVTGRWELPGLFNDRALEWESVYPGDWIVRRSDGVFTRCDHEVFTATHRPETGTTAERLTDERLRQLRDDDIVCVQDWVRSMAAELLALRARAAELEAERAKVRVHIEQRPEYIDAVQGGGSEDDVWRWRGGAEARRQLAEALGWTVPYQHGEKAEPKEAGRG